MDTLLSLSDNEIEAINPDHELVLFDHIKRYYSPCNDLAVSYLLGSTVVTSSYDWIGLYRRGWTSYNNYLTYQWAPKQDVVWHQRGRRRVVVPHSYTWENFKKEDEFQLLYVTSCGDVIGVSKVFGFEKEAETLELHFEVLESVSSPATSVEESFSNNFIDMCNFETLTLSSDSGNSLEADAEERFPITLAWDNYGLAGDFSGRTWLDELNLLNEENIVKEYEPVNIEHSDVTYTPVLVKSMSDSRVTEVKVIGKKRFSIIYGKEEEDEDEVLLPLFQDWSKSSDKGNEQCMAIVPIYSKKPFDLSLLLKGEEARPAEVEEEDAVKELQKDEETVPLLESSMIRSVVQDNFDVCLPYPSADENEKEKSLALYDVRENRCDAVYKAERSRKEERIQMVIEILKSLIGSIPSSTMPRPISCAPDCLPCVISRFVLGHFQQRLLAAEHKANQLQEQNTSLKKRLDEMESITKLDAQPTPSSGHVTPQMKFMMTFVKTAEETISLLDHALVISLTEKSRPNLKQAVLEKGQQTETKAIKNASTEYVTSKQSLKSDDDEKSGWKIINSRKIRRLKRTLSGRNAALIQAQETIQSQKGQIVLLQDLLKEVRRNVREERRHVKTARQEVLYLRRKLKAKTANSRIVLQSEPFSKDVGVTTIQRPIGFEVASLSAQAARVIADVAETGMATFRCKGNPLQNPTASSKPRSIHNSEEESKTSSFATARPPLPPKPVSWMPPFYSDKKAFREDINLQIKVGRCRLCGMNFSPWVDRRLIEEHITYHLQFNH